MKKWILLIIPVFAFLCGAWDIMYSREDYVVIPDEPTAEPEGGYWDFERYMQQFEPDLKTSRIDITPGTVLDMFLSDSYCGFEFYVMGFDNEKFGGVLIIPYAEETMMYEISE